MAEFDKTAIQQFCVTVRGYYAAHGRNDLPWRIPEDDGSYNPYKILVSELMLQQTQVIRVEPKYKAFLVKFPTVAALAMAPLSEVLIAWQGLGYNRRARYLWEAARQVESTGAGFPDSAAALVRLPGVGPNTAGAIMAYAYDIPVVFVETNIRTVYLHHFAAGRSDVPDGFIREAVAATLPGGDGAREWYWALMDYGSYLKQKIGNVSRHSRVYSKQSAFNGSRRQIRGRVLRVLSQGALSLSQLESEVADSRLQSVLEDLGRERLIASSNGRFALYRG